jgi:hypothetical protein
MHRNQGSPLFFSCVICTLLYMEADVYLDESGDMGWSFGQPNRRGGSSKYLTITYIIVPRESQHLLGRVVRDSFNHWGIDPKKEMKGNLMSYRRKMDVVQASIKMLGKEPRAHIGAITVKKENVKEHIRNDPNKLYNHMIVLGLLDVIKEYEHVRLIRDNRSMKKEEGVSIGYHLQMKLWFDLHVVTTLEDIPTDSKTSLHLQLVDWLSYVVWSAQEDKCKDQFRVLSPFGTFKRLYYDPNSSVVA